MTRRRRHRQGTDGVGAAGVPAAHAAGVPVTTAQAQVMEAVETTATKAVSQAALQHTIQVVPQGEGGAAWGEVFTLFLAHAADDIPQWGRDWIGRDRRLRELVPSEPTLAGAIATLAMRNATMTIRLDGPERTVDAVQQMFAEADLGAGLVSLMVKLSLDLYDQDNGAFLEIARSDYISGEEALRRWTSGAPMPPTVGLVHLDAGGCTRTGNPLYPVLYADPDRPSERHLLPWHMVVPIAEMPSPVKAQRGRQYSAVTRILGAAQYMRDVMIYRREMVSGQDPHKIHLVGGPGKQQIMDALALHKEQAANKGFIRYIENIVLGGLDPTKPVSVATVDLAALPEGFDYDAELRNYITLLALCLGEDYLTFAPLPGGNQGTATQSLMLERKSRGKGPAMWQKLLGHIFNFYGVLPRTVEFSFEERDVVAEQQEAELAGAQIKAMTDAINAGIYTPELARQIMADYQMGWMDDEYLAMLGEEDATPTVTVTDDQPGADGEGVTPLEGEAPGAPPAQPPGQGAQPTPGAPEQAAASGGNGAGGRSFFKRERGAPGGGLGGFFRRARQALWGAVERDGWHRDALHVALKAWGEAERKDIGDIMRQFDRAATGAVDAFMERRITRARGERAFDEAITQGWGQAATQGYTDGGGDANDLEDEDFAEIEGAIADQIEYAAAFWDELPDIREAGEDPFGRVDLYVQSLRAWYADWKLRGAANKPLTWRYGDTDHCETCEWLNDQRHRAKWYREHGYIPRQPGSETLACGGYRCQCTLVDDDGEEYTL